jgi:transposase-like protein
MRWMMEGYSVRQLALQSGHSMSKLYRIINHWLSSKQPQTTGNLVLARHLVFDGTFLHRPTSLVAVMNAGINEVISGKYGVKEDSEIQLAAFFQPLIARGLQPVSCTVDGNQHVIQVLKKLWPSIIIQRCLVHIQRQGLAWCRVNPKSAYASQLRNIFLKVTRIHTRKERNQFLDMVEQWERKYGHIIDSRPERGWVFSDVKRARSMLLKALPNMFHYLEDSNIPSSTNRLEGYFSRLKTHYRQHRGLVKIKFLNYFDWYFTLKPI